MSARTVYPPLRGDAGIYRVWIVGNSGAGKSTLAAELAAVLGVPFVALDTLFWDPGWEKAPRDVFAARVQRALDAAPRGWVLDGNYHRRITGLVSAQATDIIWLDPPLLLYFPRLCARTLGRLLGVVPPCSPGCPERWTEAFFSRESILWWCLTQHWPARKREQERFRLEGIHVGGKMRRIGGWGRELSEWKLAVEAMILSTRAT
ncbi:AAA domain-containing protein [Phanerochaete sordida]|uniref:AAA domain-containing protein n=1 Tax=Phanerochaete sordida TaxID=48140 RepID=A0A9P3GDD1_9APHY|nr:AAA domain-containing protein [Phanerochaete sordida]